MFLTKEMFLTDDGVLNVEKCKETYVTLMQELEQIATNKTDSEYGEKDSKEYLADQIGLYLIKMFNFDMDKLDHDLFDRLEEYVEDILPISFDFFCTLLDLESLMSYIFLIRLDMKKASESFYDLYEERNYWREYNIICGIDDYVW